MKNSMKSNNVESRSFEITNRKKETFTVVVDADDYDNVMASGPWRIQKCTGVNYALKGASKYLHHFLTGFKLVSHVDGNGLNNSRSNLREATRALITQNLKTARNNTSGCRGVSWHKREAKWSADIQFNGKHKYLGTYEDKAMACKTARLAREELFQFNNATRNECEHT